MRLKKTVFMLSALTLSVSSIGFYSPIQTVNATVTETLLGDVNADGKINISDAVMLQKWLIRSGSKLTNQKNADIFQDGVINAFDLVMLKRMLLNVGSGNYQGLVINEVCSSNSASFVAEDSSSPDWIEIYNGSDQAIDISGVGLTNGNKNKYKFVFPEGTTLKPNAYIMVLCDKTTLITKTEYHADFKISASGETITMTAPRNTDGTDGATLDTVAIPALQTDETYGRYADDFSVLSPTPNATNDTAEKIVHVAEPVFSKTAGFYDEAFDLILSDASGCQILYTTDGSDPRTSETAKIYSKAIKIYDNTNEPNVLAANPEVATGNPDYEYQAPNYFIDKGIIVRAVCMDDFENYGRVITNGYYIDKTKSYYKNMKVVSLSMDSEDIFGYAGLISWGKQADVEHPCNMQVYNNGQVVCTEDIGITNSGGYSNMYNPQKTFTLSARKKYGSPTINYDFFNGKAVNAKGEKIKKYDKIVLRSGGTQGTIHTRENMIQELADGLNIETQSSENCVVFLNGEFWGFYSLQEHKGTNYVESHYGIDKDNVTIIKVGGLNTDSPKSEENLQSYLNFFDWCMSADMSIDENYQKFCDTFDEQSFMDYIAFENYVGNNDWPTNNWAMWRSDDVDETNPYADGKYRMIVYDVERAAGDVSGNYEEAQSVEYAKQNVFKEMGCYGKYADNIAAIFFKVMENQTFADKFYQNYRELSKVCFTEEKIETSIQTHLMSAEEAILESNRRYVYTFTTEEQFDDSLNYIRRFFKERYPYAIAHLNNLMQSYHMNTEPVELRNHSDVIEAEEFYGESFDKLILPETITSIGTDAFNECQNLSDIYIENPNCDIADTSTTIYETATIHGYAGSTAQAYAEQYSRTFVEIYKKIASGSCNEAVNWTLYENGRLVIDGKGKMPDYTKTTETPWNAYAAKITSIEIGDSVEYVGAFAFSGCTKAAKIEFNNADCTLFDGADTLYSKTKIIGFKGSAIQSYAKKYSRTFSNVIASGTCGAAAKWNITKEGVLSIKGSGAMDNYEDATLTPWYSNRLQFNSLVISDTITELGTCAFAYCSNLETVTLSNGLESIAEEAFARCGKLKTITIPEGVKVISYRAFAESGLKTIQLPTTLETIDARAFYACANLEEISIPDSVTTLGSAAFEGCDYLEKVKLPKNITTISRELFSMCRFGLVELTIPDKVKTIEYQAFYGCRVEKLTLPASVETIEGGAFTWSDLKSITILNPNCTISDSANIPESAVISGYKGSTAEKFAEIFGYEFVALTK